MGSVTDHITEDDRMELAEIEADAAGISARRRRVMGRIRQRMWRARQKERKCESE